MAVGERTSLNELYECLKKRLAPINPQLEKSRPVYQDFRAGDVRHSLADISKAKELLGYSAKWRLAEGLDASLDWYLKNV